MKKKTTAILAAAAFSILAASCASQGGVQTEQKTEGSSEKPAEEPAAETHEEKRHSEGVDTKCEVGFIPYSGEHGEMFLGEGDRIAVISPSSLPSREQVDAVVSGLREWGYEPVEGKYVCVQPRTLDEIMEDVEWALEDPEIKAVFCVRGGYGATEVADRLPADIIKTAGKLIIGYSDVTVFHSAWTANGLPSIHACMSGTFSGFPESCFEAEKKILRGEIPTYTCENTGFCRQGEAEGILVGGNLSSFTAVIGAAYDCTKTGQPYILFLEDVREDVPHIHRLLTILKHAGVLDNAEGIVFGEWTSLPDDTSGFGEGNRGGEFSSVADMISRQFLPDLEIPVAFGFPAGHGDVNYPLLMGETAKLKVGADSFTLVCGSQADGN